MTLLVPDTKVPQVELDLPTAALNFKEFSFRGNDGNLGRYNVSVEHLHALQLHLMENYNAVQFQYSEPFIILGCKGGVPAEHLRPFSIAGLIAIWMANEEFQPLGFVIGDRGRSEVVPAVPSELLQQLQRRKMPGREAIIYLANNVFKDCIAITLHWNSLVIELPRTEQSKYLERLEELPYAIRDCECSLKFHNGPMPQTEKYRMIHPQPQTIDGAKDETDYVSFWGNFYPGTMLSSVNKEGKIRSSVTAGVLVEKGLRQRLTCSFHCWEAHASKYPQKFGSTDSEAQRIFKVLQGNPGTNVGFIRERVGDTDIALAQLIGNHNFKNQFMDMQYRPKSLLSSRDVTPNDEFLLDSYTTGIQRLKCLGLRAFICRESKKPNTSQPVEAGTTGSLAYIQFEQLACATNQHVMTTKPYIRNGACGAVLFRCNIEQMDRAQELSSTQVMSRGEIAAMMHYADAKLEGHQSGENYYIFADVFDPLIEDGWKVVQTPESTKRKETD